MEKRRLSIPFAGVVSLCSISHFDGGAVSDAVGTRFVTTNGSPIRISSLRIRRISVLAKNFHKLSTNDCRLLIIMREYARFRTEKLRQLRDQNVRMGSTCVQKQADDQIHQILVLQNTESCEKRRNLNIQTRYAYQG